MLQGEGFILPAIGAQMTGKLILVRGFELISATPAPMHPLQSLTFGTQLMLHGVLVCCDLHVCLELIEGGHGGGGTNG